MNTSRTILGICLALGGASTALAAQEPRILDVTAYSESKDLVHTEISQEDTEGRAVGTTRRAGSYWTWDGRSRCWLVDGETIYVKKPPPEPVGNGIRSQRILELALYERIVRTPAGSRIRSSDYSCRPLPQPAAPSTPRPATPTTLTTRVEDWLRVPQPTLGLSAQGTLERPGLTGAELRLWAEGVGLWAPPPTTLDNTRVEVQAWPVEYRWSMGDGTSPIVVACPANQAEPTVVGSCAGSAIQPHAAHVFERKSSVGAPDGSAYTVGLQVVWHARYRAVDGDSPGPWTALPDRLTEASRPFLAEEVRAALVTD